MFPCIRSVWRGIDCNRTSDHSIAYLLSYSKGLALFPAQERPLDLSVRSGENRQEKGHEACGKRLQALSESRSRSSFVISDSAAALDVGSHAEAQCTSFQEEDDDLDSKHSTYGVRKGYSKTDDNQSQTGGQSHERFITVLVKDSANDDDQDKSSEKQTPLGKDVKAADGALDSVMVVHKRSFQCDVCKRHFKRKGNLMNHMSSHVPVDNSAFGCHICGKRFKTKYSLNVHLVSHSGERPFVCKICDVGFKREAYLICHLRNGHPSRHFRKCKYCYKCFRHHATYNLEMHERTHTEEASKTTIV